MSRCPCCDQVLHKSANPNQLDLFSTILYAESYARGYDTGLFWDASWMPGGPWIYSPYGNFPSDAKKQMARISQEEYDAWHAGFNDGLEIRLKNNDFRVWWEDKTKEKLSRYYAPALDNA
jgi:hypothetical protein